MKIFKRSLLSLLLALGVGSWTMAADYGLPAGIQEGNILHCFNWSAKEIKAELPTIASAGFGTVQMSPLQRPDIKIGSSWHDLYRPYDMAFKSSSFCTEQDLKDLCDEASKYGIKIIVDVVANHVDKTSGYHDTWWDSNNRVRWEGGINYGNRYSITHGQLGDYGDINSELSEVCARGKAYVEKLKSLGVKGIRWDAAKHIGLPSENCNFWSTVTSVPDMYHYGEILDAPGPDSGIIKEYAKYMSVTDNKYCNYAARDNGGIPGGYGGEWVVNQGLSDTKLVYWGESHDTYSNDEWSQNVDQSVIDRAYAAYACRNGATCLYLARPNTKGFGNIKTGKGSTAFKNKHIAEVNKFRNLMTGRKDYFSSNGSACSITREGGGAVIVMKGSGNVTVENGGGYCPAGTYTDRVSGGSFTVTSTTISGNVGSSGIAVLIKDGMQPPVVNPDDPIDPDPGNDMWILGNIEGHQWTTNAGAKMTYSNGKYVASNVNLTAAAGETKCYFNITDALGADWDELNMNANRYGAATEGAAITLGTPATVVKYANGVNASGCLSWTLAPGSYDFTLDLSAMTLTVAAGGSGPINPPVEDPTGEHYVYFDGTSFTQPQVWAWSGSDNCCSNDTWGGDNMTKKNDKWYWELPTGKPVPQNIIIHEGDNKIGGGDLVYVDKATYHQDGTYTEAGPDVTKPVVTASPASGTRFDESVTVTLSVSPAATIYYTVDGSAPTTSSKTYSAPLVFENTTTLKTLAVASDGGKNEQTFTYTKKGNIVVEPGNNIITDYYKVNPNGQTGRNRTVNAEFEKLNNDNRMCVAKNALNNWSEEDLIAQGVARDIASSIKGKHEYPCIDSYAIYAAYDDQNLYLGVQYVYSTWDLYGDGILTNGAAKPYNMDGRLMIAFDLFADKDFEGVLENGNTIWDSDGQYNTFKNGTDCIWLGSTKSTVGTPGLFFPNANNKASYDAGYCVAIDAPFYGCQDGLLPSIKNIWGQAEFEYDPEVLKTNNGFTDIKGLCPDDQHTFYEFKFPLNKLGITKDHIQNEGIGVMVIDTYGQGAIGSTPYDPTTLDNAKTPYSKDESSSMEKEDKDIFTYSHARIGMMNASGVNNINTSVEYSSEPIYYNLQGVRVANPTQGVYIVRRGNTVRKEIFR